MPVLFPKLWVVTNLSSDPDALTNVTSWKIIQFPWRTGTYRDLPVNTGKLNSASGSFTYQNLPVIGSDNAVPTGTASEQLRLYSPDDAAHVPPRPYKKSETALVLAFNDDVIPEPAAPVWRSVQFTAAASNICTSSNNEFANGDVVAVASAGTIPPPLVTTTLYQFVKLNANDFLLMNRSTRAIVDITGPGSLTHTMALVSTNVLEPNLIGMSVYPMIWEPRIKFALNDS